MDGFSGANSTDLPDGETNGHGEGTEENGNTVDDKVIADRNIFRVVDTILSRPVECSKQQEHQPSEESC